MPRNPEARDEILDAFGSCLELGPGEPGPFSQPGLRLRFKDQFPSLGEGHLDFRGHQVIDPEVEGEHGRHGSDRDFALFSRGLLVHHGEVPRRLDRPVGDIPNRVGGDALKFVVDHQGRGQQGNPQANRNRLQAKTEGKTRLESAQSDEASCQVRSFL